jgi:hypothetical protein
MALILDLQSADAIRKHQGEAALQPKKSDLLDDHSACPDAPKTTMLSIECSSQELWHRGVVAGADFPTLKDSRSRQPQDPEVQPQTPMVDIPDVHFEPARPRNSIPSVDLGPSGDAGLDLEAPPLLR